MAQMPLRQAERRGSLATAETFIYYIYIYIEGSPLYMQNNAKLEFCEMSLLLCSFALRGWRFDTLLKREYVDAAL